MSHEEQLAWEARAGKPAAVAAFGVGVLGFVAGLYLPVALGGVSADADDRLHDALEHPGYFVVSGVILAVASLLLLPVLFYLTRATRYRKPQLAPTALILGVLGAVSFAVIAVWQPIEVNHLAKDFFPFHPHGDFSHITNADDYLDAVSPEQAADKAMRDALPTVGRGLAAGGTIALAFALVMISLNAMRVGLLSRFMGVLGIIVGVLYLLPLPIQVLPLFWFGALGVLFLGRWPGGRGPAWQTAEAIPWPSAADQRAALEPARAPDPEPAAEADGPRPQSRKRKKKRR